MGLYRIWPWRRRARRAWDPWREMEEIRQAMEQVAAQAAMGSFVPNVDVYHTDVGLVVRVDVPGMRPEALTIAIEDGVLKIEGHRAAERASEAAYVCCERPTGQFVRVLQLPEGVDVGSARATLGDGVLELTLPKGEERSVDRVVVQIDVVSPAEQPEDVAARG